MRIFASTVVIFGVAALLNACGGGGGSDSTASSSVTSPSSTTSTTNSGPVVIQAGKNWTMTANSSVLVPSGTTISSNGSVVTINGSSNTIYTQIGAVVSVPASATGPANNTVSVGPAIAGSTSTSVATVTAMAGSATQQGAPIDGTGAAALFWGGGHVAIDGAGNVIASDRGSLRKITQAGVVTTLQPGYAPADWEGIAIDGNGNIFGSGNSIVGSGTFAASIHELSASGALTAVSTNWETSTTDPSVGYGGLAVDSKGNLYLSDKMNNRIVKFTASGIMSVFAGSGISGNADGVGVAATFNSPSDLSIDGADNLYVASPQAVRKITPNGTTSTIYSQSAPTISVIAADKAGNVFVAGIFGLMRIDVNGNLTSYALPPLSNLIVAMAVDSGGNLYAATQGFGAQILKISF